MSSQRKLKSIWVSFDLGLKGDYSGLFAWLDEMKALECGRSLAYIKTDKYNKDEIDTEILKDIKRKVKLKESDRIYISYLNDLTAKVKGKFIHGIRERNPWEGYASIKNTDESEEDSI